MTFRQILIGLQCGESHEFKTLFAAKSARSIATHIYGRKYKRVGVTITRVA